MGAQQVLIANVLWLVFLGGWCVAYFVQARADKSGPGRYPPDTDSGH